MIRRAKALLVSIFRTPAALLALLVLAGCGRFSGEPVRISVTARKYRFEPAEIRVKKGTLVELHISTADVQHGFSVPDLGIKEPVPKGRPAVVRFQADQRGEFKIACNIICGPGHDDMAGKLIVE